MPTLKLKEWYRALIGGQLSEEAVYVIHPFKISGSDLVISRDTRNQSFFWEDSGLDDNIFVTTMDDYILNYLSDRGEVRTTVIDGVGWNNMINHSDYGRIRLGTGLSASFTEVNGRKYTVLFDGSIRNVCGHWDFYSITFGRNHYVLPARSVEQMLNSNYTGVDRIIYSLDRERVSVTLGGSYDGNRGNRLPIELVEALGVRDYIIRPFVIHEYHGRRMRTNVSRVSTENFKKLADQVEDEDFTYIGLELEFMHIGVDDDDDCENLAYDAFERLFTARENEDVYDHFDVSNDSSLEGLGYEMVGLPMTPEYIMSNKDMFDRIFDHMVSNNMVGGGSTHMHIDRKFVCGENDTHLNGMSYFLSALWWSKNILASDSQWDYALDGQSDTITHGMMINAIVGRAPTAYCNNNRTLKQSALIGADHYNWLTVKERTIEFRRPSISMSASDLFNKVEFITNTIGTIKHALIDNTDEVIIRKLLRLAVNHHFLNKLLIIKEFIKNGGSAENAGKSYPYYSHFSKIDELIEKQQHKLALLQSDYLSRGE